MSHRFLCVGLTLALAACVLLAGVAPAVAGTWATSGTFVTGVPGEPFRLGMLGEGMTIVGDEDETLVVDLEAVTDGLASEARGFISQWDAGAYRDFGFQRFRLHVDSSQASGVSLAVWFVDAPYDNKLDDWRCAPYTGTDDTGAWVFTAPPYCGGHHLQYKLVFTLADQGATGTVTVADFAVDWGEWVEPPEDDKDKDGGDDKGKDDGVQRQGSGVAYMGGSDGGGAAGGGGTGSGPGQGGAGSGGAGVASDGTGGVDTDVLLAAAPVTSAGETVTGYPLQVCDLIAGVVGGAGTAHGSGGGGGSAATGGRVSGAVRAGLTWLAVALLFLLPFAGAEVGRRRVRRRLHALVESTPDEPGPRIAAPA